MAHFKSVETSDSSSFEIIYQNCTPESIAAAIENSFQRDGYSIKSGELGNRTYVKGNRVARLLLGAFYKYFEFHIRTTNLSDGLVKMIVTKTTSGMSGGAIGVQQVKKELARLKTVFMEV